MSKWGDSGFLDEIDKPENGNGAAGAVATQEPAAKETPAPEASKPQGAGDPPAAAPAKPKTDDKPVAAPAKAETPPAATPAAPRKWTVKGKVAGAEKAWDIDEEHLDEKHEKNKWLRDQLQKADDYDRPGGAFDKRVEKEVGARIDADRVNWLVGEGLLVKTADGKLVDSPALAEFKAFRASKAAGGAAAAQPAAPAAPASEQTPRQKRISELRAVFAKDGGFTDAEMEEFTGLLSDERADAREAEREKKTAEARQKKDQEDARAKTAKDESDRHDRAVDAHVDNVVSSLSDKFKDPVSGLVDESMLKAAKSLMRAEALSTQDWAKAEAAVRTFAEGHAAKLSGYASKIVKTGAAAPPPVARGGAPVPAKKPDEELKDFDPKRGFQRQNERGFLQRMHEAE